tara:strand:+ start:9779 stop:10276 length:498 start_codon:yes stop_codon:yes gene_type:complete
MRFFVTKDLNKNSALKLIILFSLIFFVGLIVTNFLFMTKIGFTVQEVINYYLGNPETFRQPKSYGSIVEETHFHLFAMGIILMTLNHLMLFSDLSMRFKIMLIVVSFSACLLDILSSWLVRFVSADFAYLKLSSMVVEQISLVALIFIIIKSLFMSDGKPAIYDK